MPLFKIDPSEYSVIARLYEQEKISSEVLAKQYDVTSWTILNILRKYGVEIRSAAGFHTTKDNESRKNRICDLYGEGLTAKEIAKTLGVTVATIDEALIKLGLRKPLKKRFSGNELLRAKSRALMLYQCGLTIRQVTERVRIHEKTLKKFLAEEDIPIRPKYEGRVKRAKALARERLGLYQSGMTLEEIDRYLGDPKGAARSSLSRYHPGIFEGDRSHKRVAKLKTEKRLEALQFNENKSETLKDG